MLCYNKSMEAAYNASRIPYSLITVLSSFWYSVVSCEVGFFLYSKYVKSNTIKKY